jgi:hypothetical protein
VITTGVQSELEETIGELRTSDEACKKAMTEAARLADELRQEQEHSAQAERARKMLETQLKVATDSIKVYSPKFNRKFNCVWTTPRRRH